MNYRKISRFFLPLCLCLLLTISACASQPPSRFEQAQQDSIAAGNRNTAVEKEAIKGAKFNQFFPVSSGDYERVFTQEKAGFVQAKLKFKGEDMAFLAIFDTISNPSAKNDFANTTMKIDGFPMVEKGSNNTAVLVADRYQVSVRSISPNFTSAQRQEWLSKFDLSSLASLK